ncbi:LytR C-terminal domain-containing protein [Arcanobacterium phocisimile]|uniref:LytR C-terminal domain-containing protein n=1 Tax=Arcanobacterium phocisimile TaxID=1302235 RepID=A0ABX7IHK3_9ACTO|nr:LytR C-terminal domain-containing protein [Arcanobacterium phocisimile]QRV02034.1 LytR C-terminal domain-containing protein [Arcanobacterium phocisimile]
MNTQYNPRLEYRKRIQQRQTVIFGSISAVMAFLLIVSTLVWTGVIPAPFNREFSKEAEPAYLIPCPSTDIQARDLSTLSARIYNSTNINGKAGEVGQQLATLGVTVTETSNWAGKPLPEPIRIITGKNGVDAAYTLRAYLPGSVIHFDETNNSEILDVVIGKDFDGTQTGPSEADIATALEPIDGCKPVK